MPPAGFARAVFPGNIIPANRIDPVSGNSLGYLAQDVLVTLRPDGLLTLQTPLPVDQTFCVGS